MNKKLKMIFSHQYSEQGFVVPLALCLGLIMLLVGVTMMGRSQGDQVTASYQEGTSQSVGVAEEGVNTILNLINNLRILAINPLSGWLAARQSFTVPACINNSTYLNGIDVSQYVDQYGNGIWIKYPDQNPKFRILSYTYDNGVGTLQVEGWTDDAFAPSKTVLKVNIPVPNQQPIFPGLWVNNITDIGNNIINGSVLINGCTINNQIYNNSGQSSPIASSNLSNGSITVNPYSSLPSLPPLPVTVCPTATGQNCYYSIPPLSSINIPALPRSTDTPAADGNYYYLVDNTASDGSLTQLSIASASMTVTTASNSKVILFLKGNMSMKGNSYINHIGNPTDFQIFGSNGTTNYYCPSSSPCTTSTIQLGGNGTLNAFIYAPSATVGSNGCGNGGSNASCLLGSIWANNWSATSSTSNTVVTQTGSWSSFPVALKLTPPPLITPPSLWQRN